MNLDNKIIIAITALTIIAFSHFAGKWIASTNADFLVVEETLQQDQAIANYISNNLWKTYQSDIIPLFSLPLSEWTNKPKFLYFAQNFFDYLATLPYIEVKLLKPDGSAFLSSSNTLVIEAKKEGLDTMLLFMDNSALISQNTQLKHAKSGLPHTRLLPNAIFYINGDRQLGELTHSLIPILDQQGQVQLIVSLIGDFRTRWNLATHTGHLSSMIFGVPFMLLASVLLASMRHNQKVIAKQQEDNAELINAAKRAESIAVAKSQFLANVSHELRTPLNAIIGFSEIIKNQELGPIGNIKYAEYINDIHNSGSHLLTLINDILDYTKAEAEKLKIEEVDVDITHLAKACLRVVTPKAEEAEVELIESLPKDTVIISADPKRFKQVMLNLLSNSIKFTPAKGKVRLVGTIDYENRRILIQVIDTGIGIAPENISKALATFEQIDNAHSRKYEGTGLGLPLTKKLVELMKGKFHLQSESGLGTTVSLTFPIKEIIENGNSQQNNPLNLTEQRFSENSPTTPEETARTSIAVDNSFISSNNLELDIEKLQEEASAIKILINSHTHNGTTPSKDITPFLQDSNSKASSLGRPEWRIASQESSNALENPNGEENTNKRDEPS